MFCVFKSPEKILVSFYSKNCFESFFMVEKFDSDETEISIEMTKYRGPFHKNLLIYIA